MDERQLNDPEDEMLITEGLLVARSEQLHYLMQRHDELWRSLEQIQSMQSLQEIQEAVRAVIEKAKTPASLMPQGKPGEPVPEVSAEDLKNACRVQRAMERKYRTRPIPIGTAPVEAASRPRSDWQAVKYRSACLGLLTLPELRDKVAPWLAAWIKADGQPDDAIFRVAAQIPMEWEEVGVVRQGFPVDVDEFRRRLQDQGA